MTGYGISFPAVSRVSLFLLPFLRSTAYSDVVVTVVAEVQWIPNIVLVSGGRQSDPVSRTGSCVSVRCSSAVIPPPLPFRLRYPKGGFLPACGTAHRCGSPRLTRHPTQMECSPATFLTPQPPHCHGLPSAFPARLQARPHLRANIPLELGLSLTRPALACPALPWRSPGRASLWLRRPIPTPTPTPTYRRSVPASHMCLARLRRRAHASVEALLQWPADLSARSPSAPRRPFPPAVHADAPTKHPGACLPAPCSPPRPLLEIALPGPGRGLEETSFGDGKHTSGHRGSFPTGDWPLCHRTRVCRPRRTLVPFLCRIAASGRLNCYPCLPGAVVRLPEPTQDQNPLGVASGIRESQPARDLARTGQAAQRGGSADHHSPRPYPQPYPQPYRRPPYPSPPPHHHPQQEHQHKPRSITANTRGSSRSPSGGREAGGGGWAASGASWWKRREVATAAKTFAPRDGGGGLNRAWAGRHPQNTTRAAGFSHTRQKPRASGLAPCSHLSVPRTPLPGGRWNSAKGPPAALAGNRTRVNCLEGSYAHHYTTNAPQPGRPPHAGPGLAPAYSRRRRLRIPAPTPGSRRLCAAAGAPSSHAAPPARQRYAVAGIHRPHRPWAAPRPPCGPPALRSPPRPANASALTPGGQRGARSFQHPAGQSPTPPGAGRGHFPRRQGDTGPTCLHASRRRDEPRGVAVASLRAHSGSHWGSVRGRVAGPPDPAMVGQGRGVAKEALAPPWRPCARRRQRARAGALLGQRGSTGARPGTAVGRPGASPKDGGRGRRALGGLAAGQRGTAATKKGVLPPRRGIEPRSPA
ncbi:hypothetical protein AB1E18_002779 [Capra hircus]